MNQMWLNKGTNSDCSTIPISWGYIYTRTQKFNIK